MTSEQAFEIVRYKAIVEEIFQAMDIENTNFHHDRGRDHPARVNYVYEN